MKKILIFLLIASGLRAWSQPNIKTGSDDIVIAGKVSDTLLKTLKIRPYITYYENYNFDDPATGEIIPVKLNGNQFSVKIHPRGNIGYFALSKSALRSVSDFVFLVCKGDSVFIEAKNRREAHFSGRGSEKLNYQQWAGRLLDSQIPNPGVDGKWQDLVDLYKKRLSLHLAIALDSLNRDDEIGPDSIKNLIRLTTASSYSSDYLNAIHGIDSLTDSPYYDYMKKEVNFLITQQNAFMVSDPFLIQNSFMYTQYLFELNEEIARIKVKKNVPQFEIVYHNVKAEYSGLLRDAVLPYCFLRLYKINGVVSDYFTEAEKLVKDSASRAIIVRAKNASSSGVKAYNFNLPTLDGKRIQLNDFKGKIVILDTYYNGCAHCADLAKGMEDIAGHFRNRKDIVYISLDGVARDSSQFVKGAKSGLYGLPQTIYAWTGGVGSRHPLLLHYQYVAYPNLLVIGRNGLVISANPLIPITSENKKKFIDLIEKNL